MRPLCVDTDEMGEKGETVIVHFTLYLTDLYGCVIDCIMKANVRCCLDLDPVSCVALLLYYRGLIKLEDNL